jgi:virulence-associated protein VagC
MSKHKHRRVHTKGRSKGVRLPARVRKVKRKLRLMAGR